MENIAKVFAIYKAMGIRPDVKSFENRIVMQKSICLLDLMGVKTGYKFGMYLRGPYSPALTRAIFEKAGEFEKWAVNGNLRAEELEKAAQVAREVGLKASRLEIAATYAYLVCEEKKRPGEALDSLRRAKPFYSLTEVVSAINAAKGLLYKPTAGDIRKLKEEMRPWNQAGDEDFANWTRKNGM